jgi:hypothetical protein
MRPRTLIFAAALLTASASAATFEDIRELNRDFSVATWTGDSVWFEDHLSDEYVLITPAGDLRTKKDVIRELTTSGVRMDPYEPQDVHVRLYGSTAIVTGRFTQRFIVQKTRFVREVRFTDVYTRRKNKWTLVSSHHSSMTKK